MISAFTLCCSMALSLYTAADGNAVSVKAPVYKTNSPPQDQSLPRHETSQEQPVSEEAPHYKAQSDGNGNQDKWFDVWQRSFTDSMDFTVRQLDGLFGSDSDSSSQQASAEGRIQLAWEPRSTSFTDTDVRFRIRVKLPALEERVDLLLSDNEDETQDNTIRAARNTDNADRDRTTIALRFRPEQNSHYSFRVGAGRGDQLYVKARYRNANAINKSVALLYDSEVYYYSRDRLGAETGLALQYDMNDKNLIRQNNRLYFRDDTNDWLWRHEVNHLYAIDEHNAIVGRAMVEGLSRPNYRVEEVYAGIRWRNNTLREWLFFEVEPFVLWLRDEDFNASYGVAMRVEVYYGQNR